MRKDSSSSRLISQNLKIDTSLCGILDETWWFTRDPPSWWSYQCFWREGTSFVACIMIVNVRFFWYWRYKKLICELIAMQSMHYMKRWLSLMDMNCSSALNSMFRFDSSKWLGRIISIAYTKAYDYLKKGEHLFLFKCTRNSEFYWICSCAKNRWSRSNFNKRCSLYSISSGVKSVLKNASRYLRITEAIPRVVRLTDSAYEFRMWFVMAGRCIFRVAIKDCSRG